MQIFRYILISFKRIQILFTILKAIDAESPTLPHFFFLGGGGEQTVYRKDGG